MTVMAIGTRRTNAELMVDCQTLGYLSGTVLDATYGLGRFWTLLPGLPTAAIDIDPRRSSAFVSCGDFRRLPWAANTFETVVLDPPYKLNGTSTGKGPASCDDSYGVAGRATIEERHRLICDGITDCLRVAHRYLLVKCQDQICSGDLQMQTHVFTRHAETVGARLVDVLHVPGYRPQPPGRRQVHARRDYSTLLVLAC